MKLSQEKLEFLKTSNISNVLIEWGNKNYRDFPWRYTFNPYTVAISELLLRRTKACLITEAYKNITGKCRDMCCISASGEDYIINAVAHLGITNRSDLIIRASSYICQNYGGIIPVLRELLERIPGFGDYTISAIRVFGYNKNDPLIDVNTVRILARLSGLEISDSLRRTDEIHFIYSVVLGNADPVKFGYAMLDLGAIICSSIPKCSQCPLSLICSYSNTSQK